MQEHSNTYFYSAEDINRYLSGNMSSQEMHDMERAALSDPLLADAIDGFRIADKNATANNLNNIRAALQPHHTGETKVIPLQKKNNKQSWRLLAAACVLAAVAGGWWLMKPAPVPTLSGDMAQKAAPVDSLSGIANEVHRDENDSASFPVTDSGVAAVITPKDDKRSNDVAINQPSMRSAKNPVAESHRAISENEKAVTPIKMPAPAFSTANEATADMLNETASAVDSKRLLQPQNAAKSFSGFQEASIADQSKMVTGKITDEYGKPIQSATIQAGYNTAILSKFDGSFILPLSDTTRNIVVSSVGYKNVKANLVPGQTNNIVLPINENQLNEVVIVGAANARKAKGVTADFNKFRKKTTDVKMLPFPEKGWTHFYKELNNNLGINTQTASKTLEIKFTIDENGDPVDFTIVESPDEILTKKAIEFIKKAKWKNFKLNKNAVVKIQVN